MLKNKRYLALKSSRLFAGTYLILYVIFHVTYLTDLAVLDYALGYVRRQ